MSKKVVVVSVTDESSIKVFPNPASDIVAIQIDGLVTENCTIDLYDIQGKKIKSTTINQGQTIAYLDVQDVYNGIYFVKINNKAITKSFKVIVEK